MVPRKPPPSSPAECYKQIIDELVEITAYGPADHVEKSGQHYGDPRFETFLASLTQEQRSIVVDMLRASRKGAIHDALVVFDWWFDCREVAWTYRGEDMSYYETLHHDYVSRRLGHA